MRDMHRVELANYPCPTHKTTPTRGISRIDDRGPHQQILVRTLHCRNGHTYTEQTDGS